MAFPIIFTLTFKVRINTAIKLGRESTMKYPNVTVCFAKFFDNRLIEGLFLA